MQVGKHTCPASLQRHASVRGMRAALFCIEQDELSGMELSDCLKFLRHECQCNGQLCTSHACPILSSSHACPILSFKLWQIYIGAAQRMQMSMPACWRHPVLAKSPTFHG